MVACSCRVLFESQILEILEENPATPLVKLMVGNGKKECCSHCHECVDAVKQIIAEHSANTKRS